MTVMKKSVPSVYKNVETGALIHCGGEIKQCNTWGDKLTVTLKAKYMLIGDLVYIHVRNSHANMCAGMFIEHFLLPNTENNPKNLTTGK